MEEENNFWLWTRTEGATKPRDRGQLHSGIFSASKLKQDDGFFFTYKREQTLEHEISHFLPK